MPVIQKATAIATAIVTATMMTVAITGLMPFLFCIFITFHFLCSYKKISITILGKFPWKMDFRFL
jgi:hypothetical protein